MPSIKVLNIALVLLCIVITAFICTFLAISSSDTALDDTKASRDTSVNSSFTVGEDSVRKRTDEYLDLLMNSTLKYLQLFMDPQRLAVQTIGEEIMAHPLEVVNKHAWHNQARYYFTFKNLFSTGNTNLGIFFYNKLSFFYVEDWKTMARGPDEFHNYFMVFHYEDGHPSGWTPAQIKTPINITTGKPLLDNPEDAITDWNVTPRENCSNSSFLTNGSVPSPPCAGAFDAVSLYTDFLSPLPNNTAVGIPPTSYQVFITSSSVMHFSHNGVRTGFIIAGADLSVVGGFLRKIKIGGPVEGHPSRGRIYITVRSSLLPDVPSSLPFVGLFVASSHGNVSMLDGRGFLQAIPPINSTDSIIKSVAEMEEDSVDLEEAAQQQTSIFLNISTDYAPEGEDFYYRVGIMNNGFGLDWYVHIVIDRAYILGEIDRKLEETRVSISDAERKVDDDLKKARTVLYVLVVAVAVLLTVVSIVFVLKIIEPLLILEYEMAMVAVMDLEKVDRERPLSTLQEVQLMQVSFLQMMKNLVEYRNYMPASVLQGSDDDESSEGKTATHKSRSRGSRLGSIASRHSASTRVVQKQTVLHGTEAKTKRVTLLACNMISFLSGDQAQVLKKISDYLTAALLHVKATRGTPDSFSGDRLYVSWNGVRNCPSYKVAAYTFSRELTGPRSGKFSIGIASGQVRCGNMGCDGMKKFTFVGSLASWVHIVERVARMQGADIAVDNTTHEEVTNVAFTRPLLHLSFPKHSDKVLLVHEALGSKEVKEEEWMYQMAEGDANDPHTKYKASFKLFMEGDAEGARSALDGCSDDSEVSKRYLAKLVKAAQNPGLLQPFGMEEPIVN